MNMVFLFQAQPMLLMAIGGPAIRYAAKLMGVNITDEYVEKIKRMIQGESGGSETVVNNWDSNAAAGHQVLVYYSLYRVLLINIVLSRLPIYGADSINLYVYLIWTTGNQKLISGRSIIRGHLTVIHALKK